MRTGNELIEGVSRIAQKFPAWGLTRFREKFQGDAKVSTAVELQLYGDADLFAEFVRTGVASERVREVANSGFLRRLLRCARASDQPLGANVLATEMEEHTP